MDCKRVLSHAYVPAIHVFEFAAPQALFAFFRVLRATAARMSAFNAFSSILSP
jgi:hypothetical protein